MNRRDLFRLTLAPLGAALSRCVPEPVPVAPPAGLSVRLLRAYDFPRFPMEPEGIYLPVKNQELLAAFLASGGSEK